MKPRDSECPVLSPLQMIAGVPEGPPLNHQWEDPRENGSCLKVYLPAGQ